MKRVLWFKDISKGDIAKAGGKGANLGEMYNCGFPVPPGFVVTAQTYKEFIERTGIKDKINQITSSINIEDTKQLQEKANEIQKLIVATEMPHDIKEEIIEAYESMEMVSSSSTDTKELIESSKELPFVAVRSSATAEDLPEASFAGQQATFLNIKGVDKIIETVSLCWASLYTARAIYYRGKNNFEHDKVLISDVVQKMVNSDTAGVMFSVNPATNNKDEIVIEAAYGLGETVVSGSVNPDMYIIDKKTLEIKQIEVKEQEFGLFRNPKTGKNFKKEFEGEEKKAQKLDEDQIIKLAKLAKNIEKHYGNAQDIEWAIEGDEIYIVQTRAVTTLKEEKEEDIDIKENVIIKGMTASPGIGVGPVTLIKDATELDRINKGDVLVTEMTNPDMVPAMKKAAAIITNEGGITCHAAIVSREMGIPCIVGAKNATSVLKENSIVTVYATKGTVYEGKVAESKSAVDYKQMKDIETKTKVGVILGMADFAEKAAATGAEGVGLLRLEFIIANGKIHPAEYIRQNRDEEYTNMLAEQIKRIAEAFKGKPVWIRTSDIRTDEYRNLEGGDKEPKESDPMIGWHGIRRSLDEQRILKAEFKAVKRLHELGYTNCGIMIPFVIRAEEVKQAKEILREVGLEPYKNIEFGVMIETPASCWVIEEICKQGVDFVSFGTNDLTQLTLGLDRNNERIQKLFDEMHPAVLGEIKKVMKICQQYNVKTSICGQAGSRPEMAEFLVKRGIHSISANPDAVHKIKEVVAEVEKKLGV